MIWSIWEESISKNMKNDVVLSFCWGVRHVIILNSQKMTFKNWWVFFGDIMGAYSSIAREVTRGSFHESSPNGTKTCWFT